MATVACLSDCLSMDVIIHIPWYVYTLDPGGRGTTLTLPTRCIVFCILWIASWPEHCTTNLTVTGCETRIAIAMKDSPGRKYTGCSSECTPEKTTLSLLLKVVPASSQYIDQAQVLKEAFERAAASY